MQFAPKEIAMSVPSDEGGMSKVCLLLLLLHSRVLQSQQ